MWANLILPSDYLIELRSTYFIGAQDVNAENVSFKDRARFRFLLHFWPYTAQVYVPAVYNNEGKTPYVGYALAIPDVTNLELFCEELPQVLRARGVELAGYRPKESVVDQSASVLRDLKLATSYIFIEPGEGNASRDLVLLHQHAYNLPSARVLSPF